MRRCLLLVTVLLAGCGSGPARTATSGKPNVRSAEHDARDAQGVDPASIPPEPQDVEPNKGSPGADEPSHGKVDIAIGVRAFERPVMRIRVGQIVVWTNEDDVGHTVRAVDGGLPRSGLIPPRGRFEFTAVKSGRIAYRCVVHPQMRGELIVVPTCSDLSRSARHELGDTQGEMETHCQS